MLAEPMKRVAPYGSWSSPISAADVASDGTRCGWLGWVDGEIWWTESRPDEGGRVTLMRWVPGTGTGAEAGAGAGAGGGGGGGGGGGRRGAGGAMECAEPDHRVRRSSVDGGDRT